MKNKSGVAFLISPVLGLIEAFKDLKSKQSRNVLFCFCLCFGICFSVGLDRFDNSIDGISMRQEFEETKNISNNQFVSYLSEYFEFDKGDQDIYIVTVAYLVGRVTDNYHYFFLVLAAVFAFFQIKCLNYFVNEKNYTRSLICIVLTCLFLWNNIFNINGARFWTAAWIGLYCLFRVFYDKKYQYLVLSILLPMVHASFAVFPVVLLIGMLTTKLERPWIILFIASWAFSVVATDFQIQPFKNIELPFLVEKKVEYYTDREVIESMTQGTGFYWVSLLFSILSRHYIDLLILLIAINIKRVQDNSARSIVEMMIVLATMSNFGMIIPTLGRRFFSVNIALVAYSFLVTFHDRDYKKLIMALPLVWFMNLFYLAKNTMAVLDLGFLLSPVISFVRFGL